MSRTLIQIWGYIVITSTNNDIIARYGYTDSKKILGSAIDIRDFLQQEPTIPVKVINTHRSLVSI